MVKITSNIIGILGISLGPDIYTFLEVKKQQSSRF